MIIFKLLGFVMLLIFLVACRQGEPMEVGPDGPRDSGASLSLGQAIQEDAKMDAEASSDDWVSYVSYASTKLKDGQLCSTGILIDEDGMQQRPAVEMLDRNGAVLWRNAIALPMDFYQARATHCVASGPDLFVLVQADTQSVQSLSQTMLEVVRLKSASGKVVSSQSVAVSDVHAAYSAWVEKEVSNFILIANGSLQVSGHYKLMAAPEQIFSFVARIDFDVNI
ncbi:hypothetical protein [Pseudoxanthomonas wuyuanensis]|nr:hypothetical protein [Pseudoxanthomonas wuyuanensis]KAF1716642.1 hypothetical protein CSC75_19320 [Pseudoxanthomonas wuyuanensis]